MADIEAFRGIRYDLGHVGSLSNVVAPPYDVIDAKLQDSLYARHDANVIRLILNREEPGDDEQANRYSRAARLLRQWLSEGILFQESDPALYVYHQEFEYAAARHIRRGFMARVRLERFGEGSIYPHEETKPGPKQDRLRLHRACQANLSQIFGLYQDEASGVQAPLEAAIAGKTPIEAEDHLGIVHRIWPISDVDVIAAVTACMGPKSIYVADGHHRYETACAYRDELTAAGPLDPEHPANFVLMMCVSMSDPGMQVLPTHRLFRGGESIDSARLTQALAGCFEMRPVGEGADLAANVWAEIETAADQATIGLYTAEDERWVLATLTDQGRDALSESAKEHSPSWRGLGVSILHRLVVDRLLGLSPTSVQYAHLVDEVAERLESGDYPLCALVMPATLDHVRQISELGERMPAKSTYFYPKLLSGLVINPLR